MVKTGGENVFAAEVEAALAEHSAVAAAAVFGAPDGRWGERVVAAVILRVGFRPDAHPGEAALAGPVVFEARAAPLGLHAHCAARLSPFKVNPFINLG
jgi:acyl-CoA synthetase (AMP-forming)/AMP-acid ligase II